MRGMRGKRQTHVEKLPDLRRKKKYSATDEPALKVNYGVQATLITAPFFLRYHPCRPSC